MVVNFAHRGASGYYPENTMIAFEWAYKMGADGIETDVQMTKDGVLILFHDEMVNRTTDGVGFIKDYTYNELNKLDAGKWFSNEFIGIKIPSVEEVLSYFKNKETVINFEIKNSVIDYKGIEEKLIDVIVNYNMENRVILSSFNHVSMVKCKKINKNIKTALLVEEKLYCPENYVKTALADGIHPHYYSINKETIRNIKKEGLFINTYTVNDANYMRYFIQGGVDGIITNYPDKLKKVIEQS